MQAALSSSTPAGPQRFLGLDAGGTQTRWAVADAEGRIEAEGQVAGFSALQLAREDGPAVLSALLRGVAQGAGRLRGAVVGMTGFDAAQADALRLLLAAAFALPAGAVRAWPDIELACRAAFVPGQGIVLVAGTGSIAAHMDSLGQLHRAGGRGVVIDDAGGGHWIARQALRAVWRAEDEAPGASRQSLLAELLAAKMSGIVAGDWAATRQWVYTASRGELGLLALPVAEAAQRGDGVALAILQAAGNELARLALALLRRVGPQPVALAGRVWELHPLIEARLRESLPAGTRITRSLVPAQHAAARLASQGRSA